MLRKTGINRRRHCSGRGHLDRRCAHGRGEHRRGADGGAQPRSRRHGDRQRLRGGHGGAHGGPPRNGGVDAVPLPCSSAPPASRLTVRQDCRS